MEFTQIIEMLGLVLSGGGIATIVTLRYTRMKARGEAMMSMQDVYQEMVADVKADREEQKEYIRELKEDRHHLREERNELRDRIEDTSEKVRTQAREIARLGRRVDSLTPLICTKTGCPNRQRNIREEDQPPTPTPNGDENENRNRNGEGRKNERMKK